jgi:endonuclease G
MTSRWAGVENWITKTSNDADIRVSVFSGPVFSDEDPTVDYLKIPKAFWKIVAWIEEGELMSTAILADQGDLVNTLLEPPGRESLFGDLPDKLPEDYHVTVSEIERLTGLDFGPLKRHDILSRTSSEAKGSAVVPKRIYSFKDIMKRG